MIKRSRYRIEVKGILNIGKLLFYLIVYLHWLGCFWFMVVEIHAPEIFIIQQDGTYRNSLENTFEVEGKPLLYQDWELNQVFGESKFFRSEDWKRPGPTDVLGWKSYNERWDSRNTQWCLPLNFVNPAD